MLRNDWPGGWFTNAEQYYQTINVDDFINVNTYAEAVKNNFSEEAKEDFENWLMANDYTFEYESDFVGNGEYRHLDNNEYRVVFRTGLNIFYVETVAFLIYDYHFWYQIHDGRWANKHGEREPELLPVGITPFSEYTSGWNLESYVNFYDGTSYSYIITVE